MEIREPTLEELSSRAEEHLGLRLEDDGLAIAQLAAIGLTLEAWRNTTLEDLHAGDHPSGGFPDADMMRFNIATTRVLSAYVAPDHFDWKGLRAALTDPDRALPGGVTVGELAGEEFEELASDSQRVLAGCRRFEQERGFAYPLIFLALRAGLSYKGWYGSPWWGDVVDLFIELLADPSSSAWKYDEGREAEPLQVADRQSLARVLLEAPESLDDDSIYWCLKHGLDRQATFGGFVRWRRRRDPDWVDPAPWLSEG
jgi:hypothetical protein